LQFVATGNAVVGFIAKSQLGAPQLPEPGCVWEVPVSSYTKIEQQAVLLEHASRNDNARRFLMYLRSDDARDIMSRHGYGVLQ
jgi:molybdate transport system substrate-binding protein